MSLLEFEQGRKVGGSVSLPLGAAGMGRPLSSELHHELDVFKGQCIMGFLSHYQGTLQTVQ